MASKLSSLRFPGPALLRSLARAAALPLLRTSHPPFFPASFASASRAQMAFPTPSPSALPPSSWVILGSIPRVSAAEDGDLPEGAELSLALAAPPRASTLIISPRVFPEPATPRFFPFVLAADPSGLLLLQANLGCPISREVIDRPGHQACHWRESISRYYVLDTTTSSAFRLPDPEEEIMHQALLGLISSPGGGGHYMVAELQPIIGADEATLLCFSSEVGEWVEKPVHYPLPPRPLAPICVISHHGKLWWVDLSWGVMTSDPFADEPVLSFIPFPSGRVLKCREAWGVTDKYRYVGVSVGKLRFVDTYMTGGRRGTPKVSVWTLADPDSKDWTLEHEASFADIWADESYKATGLPKKISVVAPIHPKNPDVIYFILEQHLFGVDVRAHKVVECEVYDLVAPPSDYIANRFVRTWELPQVLSSGLLNWSNGNNLTGKTKASSSQGSAELGSPEDYHMVGYTRQTFIG